MGSSSSSSAAEAARKYFLSKKIKISIDIYLQLIDVILLVFLLRMYFLKVSLHMYPLDVVLKSLSMIPKTKSS
jgi:hypothetical protein